MIAVSHTLCEYAAGPQNSGDTGVPPLTDGVVADPEKYVLPVCITLPNLFLLAQTVPA